MAFANYKTGRISLVGLMRVGWRLLGWLFAAAMVSVLLHSDAILRHFHSAPEKVGVLMSGPRTDVGDNYYYFTMLRHAPERVLPMAPREGDPDGGDHRNVNAVTNAYAAALHAGHLLYRMATALTSGSREAVLLTSILHTAVLALSFVIFAATLLGEVAWPSAVLLFILAALGLVFIDAFGIGMYLGRPYWVHWANAAQVRDPNALRLINPTLFWAVGLVAAAFIVRWIRQEISLDYFSAIALAGLTGLFSISVGATLTLALGLTIIFEALVNRVVRWRLLGVALAATAGLAWSYLQLRAYSATSLGLELRHGEFLGFAPKWQFLFLLALIPVIWRILGKERVFISALVMSAMIVGMFCESFHLGSRLWMRGAVVYAWTITALLVTRIALGWVSPEGPLMRGRMWQKVIVVALMGIFVFQAQQQDTNSWRGFVERDKWELFEWIDNHLPPNSVVASADIEDAFLLPIYTPTKPLYAMYGLTSRSPDDELRRYFYDMALYARNENALLSTLQLTRKDMLAYYEHVSGAVVDPWRGEKADATIFLHLVVYYAYNKKLSGLFDDTEARYRFEIMLRSRAEEAKRLSYALDFAIIDRELPLPLSFVGWQNVYQNKRFVLVRNPSRMMSGR